MVGLWWLIGWLVGWVRVGLGGGCGWVGLRANILLLICVWFLCVISRLLWGGGLFVVGWWLGGWGYMNRFSYMNYGILLLLIG